MDVLIAIGHFVGAIVLWIGISFGYTSLNMWTAKRSQEQIRAEWALKLDIPLSEVDDNEHFPTLLKTAEARWSNELLRNRLSDLVGLLTTIAGWGVSLVMIVVLVIAAIETWEDLTDAVYVWFVPAIQLVWVVIYLIIAFLCKVLTGRYPGEAKRSRKNLLEAVRLHQEHTSYEQHQAPDNDEGHLR